MRIYMMERFLERLAQSEYRDNFIIKGGILVTAMIGVAHRSTMDIDTSMKNLNLSAEDALRVVNQVKDIDLDDGVSFEVKDVSNIMDEMEYPGIRVTMNANVGRLITPLKIDISTGDVITPRAIEFNYLLLNEEGYQVEGQKGTWTVTDEKTIDEQRFVLMVNDQKPDLLPSIVVQSDGKFITSTASGFDNATVRKVRELLHHEKFLENGTAERARESGTEQNYNMIDGCVNNVPKKPRVIGGRVSVLDRLHIKQAERARKDNAQVQQQERTRKN